MSTNISGKLNLEVQLIEVISSGLKKGVIPSTILKSINFKTGTTDGKIDLGYYIRESGIAASTTTSYDLAGSLTDTEGTTITFAEIACIAVVNRRTTALAWLAVGPGASNGFGLIAGNKGFWTGTGVSSIVGPDSFMCLYDEVGVPVVAGTGDVLGIVTSGVSGSTNSYDLIILGRSA